MLHSVCIYVCWGQCTWLDVLVEEQEEVVSSKLRWGFTRAAKVPQGEWSSTEEHRAPEMGRTNNISAPEYSHIWRIPNLTSSGKCISQCSIYL